MIDNLRLYEIKAAQLFCLFYSKDYSMENIALIFYFTAPVSEVLRI